jgi:branched-chain amino acid transport system substrate-binding protein
MARARRSRLALIALAGLLAAGCGTAGTVQGGNDTYSATTLTVYTDLPLLGSDGALMTSIDNGAELALYEWGGHVGRFHVSIEQLNDASDAAISPNYLRSDTTQTAHAAYVGSSDLSTIAYIGSSATAISLGLNNQNDVLQISPASDYLGFTDRGRFDRSGDPGAFYPNGQRTFARLVPTDAVEAGATLSFMRSLGVRRLAVIGDDSPYDSVIAREVATAAAAHGVALVASRSGVRTGAASAPRAFAALASSLARSHPDAVLFGGAPNAGADALFRELHALLPHARLFAPSELALPSFRSRLGAAAAATYVTSPVLEPSQYPRSARAVLARYRRLFPGRAPSSYALYGYEAMEDVLLAIRGAGRRAANRNDLLAAFHRLGRRGRDGVIGPYTLSHSGDISQRRFDGYRVSGAGHLVLVRALRG